MLHSPHRDFRREPIGKVKFSGRNAAERNALDVVFLRKRKTGAVAGGKEPLVILCHLMLDDRTHRMKNILTGQIESRSQLCRTGLFAVTLPGHLFCTGQPQLDARIGMNAVIDASMARDIAACQASVGRIDDGIAAQGRNISLPKVDSSPYRRQIGIVKNTFSCYFFL